MTDSENTHENRGRKIKKERAHVALTPELMAYANYMGEKGFGARTGYIEHLLLNDMKAHGITWPQLLKMTEEWEAKKASNKKPRKGKAK